MRRRTLIFSWSLYDLANQFFALNVVSLYFPRWLTLEMEVPEISYSIIFGISVFFVAVSAPILGTISDIAGLRKRFLIYLTLISVAFTLGLGLCGNVLLVLLFFAIANFGCQTAIVFYNALIVNVAPREEIGLVSGVGRMFGYLGAMLALFFTKPVVLKFGYQPTFIVTAMLFLFFSLPCMIFIREEPKGPGRLKNFLTKENLKEIFARIRRTLFESLAFEDLRNFLKAAFFGLCVVNSTILFMSIYVGKVFGAGEAEIINLIAFSTLFAIVASLASGIMSDRVGYKRCLVGVFLLWGLTLFLGGVLKAPFQWLIGALAGISLGSTWVISRALAVRLVPKEKIGEIFGLFNLVGYLSAIVGPMVWGIIIWRFSFLEEFGLRLACFSSIIFIAIAIIYLLRLKGPKAVI